MRPLSSLLIRFLFIPGLLFGSGSVGWAKQDAAKPDEARLKPAYRFERSRWVYVHLEGSPADIGYQHGYLLAPEIEDGFRVVRAVDTHLTKRDWNFFRAAAQNVLVRKQVLRVSVAAERDDMRVLAEEEHIVNGGDFTRGHKAPLQCVSVVPRDETKVGGEKALHEQCG